MTGDADDLDMRLRGAAEQVRSVAGRRAARRPPVESVGRRSRSRRRRRRVAATVVAAAAVVAALVAVWPGSEADGPQIMTSPPTGTAEPGDASVEGWTLVAPATAVQGADVASAVTSTGGRLVAVGIDAAHDPGSARTRPGVWLSEDGEQWRRVQAGAIEIGDDLADAGVLMTDVAAEPGGGGGRLVAVGYANFEPETRALAWISEDRGDTWQRVDVPTPRGTSTQLNAVAIGADGTVRAVGVRAQGSDLQDSGRPALWRSEEGRVWDGPILLDDTPAGLGARDVTWRDGRTVVVGSSRTEGWRATAWVLDDDGGPARQASEIAPGVSVSSVTAVDAGFLAAGAAQADGDAEDTDAVVYHSADGLSWAPVATIAAPGRQWIADITAAGDGRQVAVGTDRGRAAIWTGGGDHRWRRLPQNQTVFPDGGHVSGVTETAADGLAAVGAIPGDAGPDLAVWLRRSWPAGGDPTAVSAAVERVAVTGARVTVSAPESLISEGWSSHAVLVVGSQVVEVASGELGFAQTLLDGLDVELPEPEQVSGGELAIGSSGGSTVAVWRGDQHVIAVVADFTSVEQMRTITDTIAFVENRYGAVIEPRPGSGARVAVEDGVSLHQSLDGFGSLDIRLRTTDAASPSTQQGSEVQGGIYVTTGPDSASPTYRLLTDSTVTYLQPLPHVAPETVHELARTLQITWTDPD